MKTQNLDNWDIKKGIICKNISGDFIRTDINKQYMPKSGDAAVFKVLEIGKHTRIQTTSGRNTFLIPEDLIMCAFGTRYASGQIEGYVPTSYLETYDILGQGGVVGEAKSWHANYDLVGTTTVELVGYITDKSGNVLNSIESSGLLYPFNVTPHTKTPKVILSVGTSMDSGKTSSAAFLAHGIKKAGKIVSFIKLTGTVYTKDKNYVKDYGAHMVADFSDFGFPSTYMCEIDELLDLYQSLLNHVQSVKPDYVIVEIADGLLERETKALLEDEVFRDQIYGAVFSAADSMSAIAGAKILADLGYNLYAISGLVTTSPLLVNEIKNNSDHRVMFREELMSKEIIDTFEKKRNLIDNDKVVIN